MRHGRLQSALPVIYCARAFCSAETIAPWLPPALQSELRRLSQQGGNYVPLSEFNRG